MDFQPRGQLAFGVGEVSQPFRAFWALGGPPPVTQEVLGRTVVSTRGGSWRQGMWSCLALKRQPQAGLRLLAMPSGLREPPARDVSGPSVFLSLSVCLPVGRLQRAPSLLPRKGAGWKPRPVVPVHL